MEINEVSRDKNVVVREYILDANDVKRLENKTVDELNKKKYLIEGFRPGRVPKEAYKLRLRDDFYNIYVLDEAIEEVDAKLHTIMVDIYNNSVAAAQKYGLGYDLIKGANIAGIEKVVDAMIAQGNY